MLFTLQERTKIVIIYTKYRTTMFNERLELVDKFSETDSVGNINSRRSFRYHEIVRKENNFHSYEKFFNSFLTTISTEELNVVK